MPSLELFSSGFYRFDIWKSRFKSCFFQNFLSFFDKFRFECHSSDTFDFAIDVMISVDESDVFYFCPLFDASSFKF